MTENIEKLIENREGLYRVRQEEGTYRVRQAERRRTIGELPSADLLRLYGRILPEARERSWRLAEDEQGQTRKSATLDIVIIRALDFEKHPDVVSPGKPKSI